MSGDFDAVKLYHSTAPENARAIMRDGFLDGEIALYAGGVERRGQFVSDTRLLRKPTDVVIEMDWDGTDEELASYACNTRVWPPDGNDYREWHVPGSRLNRCGRQDREVLRRKPVKTVCRTVVEPRHLPWPSRSSSKRDAERKQGMVVPPTLTL